MPIPAKQWRNWAERIGQGEHLEEEMQNAGVLPNGNTPLPPTNATLHILSHENGYGTPDREFVAHCGTRWRPREGGGEHKYFFEGETHWYKHVNCRGCRRVLEIDHG
jgi:hypothetical protein